MKKKRSKNLLMIAASLVLMVYSFAFSSASTSTAYAATPSINKTSATMYIGKTETLKVSGTSKTVTWKSSNTKVATVTNKGKVTPRKEGKATITASVSGKKLTCKVTVKKPYITPTSATIYVGSTKTIKLTGATISSCKSSSTTIASVSKSGVVTGKKAGSATITITDTNKKTYKCKITVKKPTLNITNTTLQIGGNVTLKLTGATAASYSSSNSSVASVSSKGVVSAKALGNATITVTDTGKRTYTCIVTVKGCSSHSWDAGRVTKEPTCMEEGSAIYTCKVCKTTKTDVLPVNPDNHPFGGYEVKIDEHWIHHACPHERELGPTKEAHSFENGVCSLCKLTCPHPNGVKITEGPRKGYYLCENCGIEPTYIKINIGYEQPSGVANMNNRWEVDSFRNLLEWEDDEKTILSPTFKGFQGRIEGLQGNNYYEIVGISSGGFINAKNNNDSYGNTLVLPQSVKSLSGSCFGYSYWNKIVLPEGLTEIPDNAFYYSKVKEVVLPSTITKIGASAFSHSDIESATLPEGLTTISSCAFQNCYSLESITLPASLTTIESSAFQYSNNLSNVVFKGSNIELIPHSCFNGTALESINIPSSIKKISNSAFYATKLAELTIPSNVETIDEWAFANCEKLTKVNISEGVKYIGTMAFAYSGVSNPNLLEEVLYPDSVLSASADAFAGRTGFKRVRFGRNMDSISTVILSNSTSTMEDHGLTILCDLTNIPESTLGVLRLFDCSKIRFKNENGEKLVDDDSLIYSRVKHSFDSEGKCQSCDYQCSHPEEEKIVHLNTSPTCTEDGIYRFYCKSCKATITITTPAFGHTYSDEWSADADYHWKELTCPDAGTVAPSKEGHDFDSKGICKICDYRPRCESCEFEIANSGANKGYYICKVCGNKPEYVKMSTLGSFPLDQIYDSLDWEDEEKTILAPIFLAKAGSERILTPGTYYLFDCIPDYFFNSYNASKCSDTIVLPSSIKSLSTNAFASNTTFKKVVLPEGITAIPQSAFAASAAQEIVLPSTIKIISQAAFYQSSIKTISLPDGLESIGNGAFSNCPELTMLSIPSSVKSIGDSAFSSCKKLESVSFSEGLQSLGSAVFTGDRLLKEVFFPDSVISIDQSSPIFSGCASLKKVRFGASLTSLYNVFYGEVDLDDGGIILDCDPSVINTYCFSSENPIKCSKLKDVAKLSSCKDFPWGLYHNMGEDDVCASCGFICTEHIFSNNQLEYPTCTQDGYKLDMCDICHKTVQTVLPKFGHTYDKSWHKSAEGHYIECICEHASDMELAPVIPHEYENGHCKICYYICPHDWSDENTTCSICGKDEPVNPYVLDFDDGADPYVTPETLGITESEFLLDLSLPATFTDEAGNTRTLVGINMDSLLAFGIEKLTIPDGVLRLTGSYTYNEDITEIDLPGTLESICSFEGCNNLTKLNVPITAPVSSLPENFLYGCDSLESFTIPEAVASIGSYAFAFDTYSSDNGFDIVIPQNVNFVGCSAFCNFGGEIDIQCNYFAFDYAAFENVPCNAFKNYEEVIYQMDYNYSWGNVFSNLGTSHIYSDGHLYCIYCDYIPSEC